MDKAEPPELADEERIRHAIGLLGPAMNRQVSAAMRRAMEQRDPDLYRQLSKDHPLLFGEDSVERIMLEFPELFRPAEKKPKP